MLRAAIGTAELLTSCLGQAPLNQFSCLAQWSEARVSGRGRYESARHPHSIDAPKQPPADADRQGNGTCMWPDPPAVTKAVAASPGSSDQVGNLGRVAGNSIVRVVGLGKQRQQRLPLLFGRESDVGEAGRTGENWQFLANHVSIYREWCDPMCRFMDYHLKTVQCHCIAWPGYAPGQFLQSRRSY